MTKSYIHQTVLLDNRYIPPKETILSFPTHIECVRYLEIVGGLYRNILHNFEYIVKKED